LVHKGAWLYLIYAQDLTIFTGRAVYRFGHSAADLLVLYNAGNSFPCVHSTDACSAYFRYRTTQNGDRLIFKSKTMTKNSYFECLKRIAPIHTILTMS